MATLFRSGHCRRSTVCVAAFTCVLILSTGGTAHAQHRDVGSVYQPLNQFTPPGTAGAWAAQLHSGRAGYLQPVRISLPGNGRVAFYNGSAEPANAGDSPAQARLAVGHTYRLRISEMPQYPGVELYPSVELLDRLHPPRGRTDEFPIPVSLTRDEIESALQGRLVTKVVYLEQPQLAPPRELDAPSAALTVPPRQNVLAQADRLGRPMLILRLGGRLPDAQGDNAGFFGTGGSIAPSQASRDAQTGPPENSQTQ